MALADLTTPRSHVQVLSRLLTLIAGRGLPITNFHSGDPLRHLLEVTAQSVSDVERLIAALAAGGYLELSAGEWLDVQAADWGLSRQSAVTARLTLTLTAGNFGPYELQPGVLWFSAAGGLRYSSATGGTLYPNSSLSVEVIAEAPGSAYNVPAGLINQMLTPLVGVSVSNPASGVLVAGADRESDEALRTRARLRWSELGGGATRTAYEFWALTAHPSVDQVRVLDQHPRGQGTLDVVVWGAGGLGSEVVETVNSYIQNRRPLTADVLVYSATPRSVDVNLTLYAPGADHARVEAEIGAALGELQRQTAIGSALYRAGVIEVAMLPAGMIDARVDLPDAVTLLPSEALVLTPSFAWGTP